MDMSCRFQRKIWQAYRRVAERMAKICREHGALEYIESVADDVKPGKWTSFPQGVNKRVMNDPRVKSMCNSKSMPFDGKRMFWGGFKSIVEVKKSEEICLHPKAGYLIIPTSSPC